jgi:hypothetical protein
MMSNIPLRPAHPERTCWGCDKYGAADDLACGNGTIHHARGTLCRWRTRQFSSAIFLTTAIACSAVVDVPCSVSTYPVQLRRRSSLKMNG